LAEEELNRTRKKFRSRLVDEADVLRAEDALHATDAATLQIESVWKSVQAELATLSKSSELYASTPEFDLYDLPILPSVDEAVAYALGRSRVLKAIDIQRGQLQILQNGLEEQTRPDLALNLTGALVGGSDEFGNSLEVTHPDVMVALALRYPLGNRTARADVEKVHLQIRQLNLVRQDAALRMESSLRAIVVQLEQLRVALAASERRIETARKKTLAEQDIYRQGRGDLTFVIQSRDREALAKLDRAEKSAIYHQLVMSYRSLADELLPSDYED
jgi:outer membrane protein TolC